MAASKSARNSKRPKNQNVEENTTTVLLKGQIIIKNN